MSGPSILVLAWRWILFPLVAIWVFSVLSLDAIREQRMKRRLGVGYEGPDA